MSKFFKIISHEATKPQIAFAINFLCGFVALCEHVFAPVGIEAVL